MSAAPRSIPQPLWYFTDVRVIGGCLLALWGCVFFYASMRHNNSLCSIALAAILYSVIVLLFGIIRGVLYQRSSHDR